MGAWIETVRGLSDFIIAIVAPFMGAWIETWISLHVLDCYNVAPFMGAWIETEGSARYKQVNQGRTLHGCVD